MSKAPAVVGKLVDWVCPLTYALPAVSTAIPVLRSSELPPRYVPYSRPLPVAFSFATKTSLEPFAIVSKAPAVVGKLADKEDPVTWARPAASTAIAVPRSLELPPRYVPYSKALPVAFSFATKTSFEPFQVVSKAPGVVGKSAELVDPVT